MRKMRGSAIGVFLLLYGGFQGYSEIFSLPEEINQLV